LALAENFSTIQEAFGIDIEDIEVNHKFLKEGSSDVLNFNEKYTSMNW